MIFTRYAIYYAPPPDAPWACFATSLLGWDMQTGRNVDHPLLSGLPLPASEIARAPARYGVHATLKPPFHLAVGADQSDLETTCANLCRTLPPLSLGQLHLTRMGRFLALCPAPSAKLSTLAAACVRDLDHLRRPATQAEQDRRHHASLNPRQEANLMAWGYPYVLDDFRFHITLTGRLPKPDLDMVQAVLARVLIPLLQQDIRLGDLALAGEDEQGQFHLLQRFNLSG